MIEIDGSYEEAGGQIFPFLAVAEGESTISVFSLTDHLRTNLWVIDHFLPLETHIKEGKRLVITMTSQE